MSKPNNLIGVTFSRLLVLERSINSKAGKTRWKCKCVCGSIKIVVAGDLLSNKTKSCGCLNLEQIKTTHVTHGQTVNKTLPSEYEIWSQIKMRCTNPNNKAYKNYGGRGIRICDSWNQSYEAFIQDMGPRPSKEHSIDRWPNNDGNYEPTNCRWATRKQQARNTRATKWIEYNNQRKSLVEWAEYLNANQGTLSSYLRRGGKFEDFYAKYSIQMPKAIQAI